MQVIDRTVISPVQHAASVIRRPSASAKLGLAAVAAAAGSVVHAAVPAAVTTAVETAGSDSISIGTLVLVAIVGIFAFKLLRRAL